MFPGFRLLMPVIFFGPNYIFSESLRFKLIFCSSLRRFFHQDVPACRNLTRIGTRALHQSYLIVPQLFVKLPDVLVYLSLYLRRPFNGATRTNTLLGWYGGGGEGVD